MRPFHLARLGAEAELLRLKLAASRTAVRLALAALAALFLACALAGLHVAAVLWLAGPLGPVGAVLAVAGGDLLIAALLVLIAARSVPGAMEAEARGLRDSALAELRREAEPARIATRLLPTLIAWLLARRR